MPGPTKTSLCCLKTLLSELQRIVVRASVSRLIVLKSARSGTGGAQAARRLATDVVSAEAPSMANDTAAAPEPACKL